MVNTVIVIAGPTASGKSAAAAELARRVGGMVINADSQQLYAALPILTAQPSLDLTGQAPHMLYGIVDPTQRASAAWWAGQAQAAIRAALGAGQMPIVVGGTGLYLEALMQGLSAIPAIPDEIRAEAAADLAALGREAFHTRLIAADPAAEKLKPGDTQRLLRAWEVFRATGQALSRWQAAKHDTSEFTFQSVVILPPRETLRAACDRRFLDMMERGAESEVRAFLLDHPLNTPAARAVGFAPLAALLSGTVSRAEAVAQAQAQTRQYAKRQSTWFRNRFLRTNPATVMHESADEKLLEILISFT